MKIGVNLLPFRRRLAGVGRYAKNVIENLAEIDGQNLYYLFVTEESRRHFQIQRENFRQVLCPFAPKFRLLRILWEQLILPWQLLYFRIDLLFTPSVAIPLWVPCKTVTTIHDMIPFHQGIRKYPKVRAAYMRWATRRAAKRSDLVLTVSEHSRQELIQFCQLSGEKILVAPDGVDEKYSRVDSKGPLSRCRTKYKLPDRFILFVGTLEPGKNILKLVEAFRRLKSQCSIPHKLVIVGPQGWGTKAILKTIENSALKDEIRITGFIPEEDLPFVYNAADLFVFPSLYEGFGLPPLEAMACGTPVVASNVPALPEVVGEAALLVDPYDIDELVSAMERILRDRQLRERLASKGMERARGFSWKKTAEIVLGAFREVEEGNGR